MTTPSAAKPPVKAPQSPPAEAPVNREVFERSLLVTLLRTALAVGEVTFARRTALAWLTAYPGDLPVNLLHAQALLRDGTAQGRVNAGVVRAVAILKAVCQSDPEYLEAQELLAKAASLAGTPAGADTAGTIAAMGGVNQAKGPGAGPEWGGLLRQARKALAFPDQNPIARPAAHSVGIVDGRRIPISAGSTAKVFENAEQAVHQVMAQASPAPVLAGVTHLEIAARRSLPSPAMRSLAELYRARWPECIQFKLLLADSLMGGGEADQAVALLHEAAAQDITGQVPTRLWGPDHPYRALWPDALEARLDLNIPAGVAAALGWNQLPSGLPGSTSFVQAEPAEPSNPAARLFKKLTRTAPPASTVPPAAAPGPRKTTPTPEVAAPAVPQEEAEFSEELQSIQEELGRVAGSLKKPQLARTDGRFPVYVMLSSRKGLEAQYGQQEAAIIEGTFTRLAEAVRGYKDWGALVYYVDDGYKVETKRGAKVTVSPARPEDAWSIKLALADLDAALAKHGEMIGALLIVGGPEIIPFHHLPNPVDDADLTVPSDNPYSTRDENYFIPEWPVGRLPGGCGPNPKPLVEMLQNIAAQHRERSRREPFLRHVWSMLREWLQRTSGWKRSGLGYSAAVWKRASLSVFRPVGDARDLLVSPPVQACEKQAGLASQAGSTPQAGAALSAVLYSARFGYFNLHGLPDATEWYGQKDPTEAGGGPDYPIALRPQDLAYHNGNRPPQVVFTEACYGAHITNRTIDDALALKFLSSGSQAVVGSTCTAYGAVTTPLTAADLLGYAFWTYVRDGIPAGDALRRAKVHLARVMHRRQGYLDGEDQKTLISFILFGDPLAQVSAYSKKAKSVFRPLKSPGPIKAVCDRSDDTLAPTPLSPQTLTYVKHVVSQYLPGMADADLSLTQEHAGCAGGGHSCPTAQLGAKSNPAHKPNRQVVTLSKQVQQSAFTHRHYARLTLDAQGKLVKLVVSR